MSDARLRSTSGSTVTNSCFCSGPSVHVLLIIEAEIATTQLISQVFRYCAAYGVRATSRLLNELSSSDLKPHVIPFFIRCGDPLAQAWAELFVMPVDRMRTILMTTFGE